MVNPATIVRDVVAALHRWFEKAEREEMEYRREIIKPPVDERLKHDKITRSGAGPVLDLSDQVGAPAAPPAARPRPTLAPPQHIPPPPAAPPPPTTGVAGLRKRQAGDSDDQQAIVQNAHNDTLYMQRNEVVAQVARHYERFGPQLSAAILAKSFLPNGLEAMLAKLGLPATGDSEQDHESIADFIDANGVADFCSLTGIRNPEESRGGVPGSRPTTPNPAARPQVRPASPARVPDTPSGAAPKMQLRQVNIKPVSLAKEPTPPLPPPPPAAPPPRTAPPAAVNLKDRPGSDTDQQHKKSTAERNAEAERLLNKELGSDRFFKE